MIELYCVVDRPEAALAAIAGEVPDGQLIRTPRVACVARPCRTAGLPTGGEELTEHDRLIRRMMEVCTVVPFRYGTVLPAPSDAEREIEKRAEMFEQLLDRLRGQVELALRAHAVRTEADCGFPATGRAYLKACKRQSPASRLGRLHRTLTAAAADSRLVADGLIGIKASYLVAAADIDRFCRLVAGLVKGAQDLTDVSLTGPWPPYSFVDPDTGDEKATMLPSHCGAGHG